MSSQSISRLTTTKMTKNFNYKFLNGGRISTLLGKIVNSSDWSMIGYLLVMRCKYWTKSGGIFTWYLKCLEIVYNIHVDRWLGCQRTRFGLGLAISILLQTWNTHIISKPKPKPNLNNTLHILSVQVGSGDNVQMYFDYAVYTYATLAWDYGWYWLVIHLYRGPKEDPSSTTPSTGPSSTFINPQPLLHLHLPPALT